MIEFDLVLLQVKRNVYQREYLIFMTKNLEFMKQEAQM